MTQAETKKKQLKKRLSWMKTFHWILMSSYPPIKIQGDGLENLWSGSKMIECLHRV